MPPKKGKQPAVQENVSLGPQVAEGTLTDDPRQSLKTPPLIMNCSGTLVFGVCRIFASFNDTFIHVTDLR